MWGAKQHEETHLKGAHGITGELQLFLVGCKIDGGGLGRGKLRVVGLYLANNKVRQGEGGKVRQLISRSVHTVTVQAVTNRNFIGLSPENIEGALDVSRI